METGDVRLRTQDPLGRSRKDGVTRVTGFADNGIPFVRRHDYWDTTTAPGRFLLKRWAGLCGRWKGSPRFCSA